MNIQARRVLVTGGSGFLGGALCRALLREGLAVRSFSRTPPQDFAGEIHTGDISKRDAVMQAAQGCDLVFHVAAKAGIWGDPQEFEQINVAGTQNIIDACQAHGIGRLVYTSSPSVVYSGRDENNLDEAAPYPAKFLSDYPRTKAIAEQRVLAANNTTFATVALRPHLIWGPGDNHLFPRLLQRARAGKLRRIGAGSNVVDATYIDNAVEAHLLAGERLSTESAIAGKAYFIANGEPLPLWELINRMLACANVAPVTRMIPASLAYLLGGCCESVFRALGLSGEPPMTRFVARQLSTSHWYDLTAASRDLGYTARVHLDEGLSRLRESLVE